MIALLQFSGILCINCQIERMAPMQEIAVILKNGVHFEKFSV